MFFICLGTSLPAVASNQTAFYPANESSYVNPETSKNSSNYSAQKPHSHVIQSKSNKELYSQVKNINSSNVNSINKVLPEFGASKMSSVVREETPIPTNSSIKNSTYNSLSAQKPISFRTDSALLKEIDLQSIDDNLLKNTTSKISSSVGRKGIPPELLTEELVTPKSTVLSTTFESMSKFKPTTSGAEQDFKEQYPNKTSLIIGLSFGILMLLSLGYVAFWRLYEVWTKRQYKQVDFLVDGLYIDT